MTYVDTSIKSVTADGYEADLGVIESIHLGKEDHGIFTFNLDFRFAGSGQGIGHLCIGSPGRDEWNGEGLHLINDTLTVLGRNNLFEVKGKMVYVLRDPSDRTYKIIGLQQVLGDDRVIWADYFKSDDDE